MKTMTWNTTLALGGSLLFALGANARVTAQSDVIRKTNGQALRKVEVLSETADKVKFKVRKKEQTVNSTDVASIEYGGAGEVLDRARYASEKGDYTRSANLYQEVADSAKRDTLKAWASFWAARQLFLASAGDASQAGTAASTMESWLSSNADHRLSTLAHETLGQAQLAAGKTDEARGAFAALGKLAIDKNLGPMWVARGKFGEAQALVASGKFSDARTAFVAASATLSAEVAANREAAELSVAAKTGEGECYLAEKRSREAQDFFRRLKSTASRNPMLAAAASCGEAQAVFEAAKGKKDVKAMRRAQTMLAEVSATDISDGDASPKAVYLLGQLILTLGQEHEGKDYLQRAKGMFRQVVTSYPKSRWALAARKALKG